MKTKAQISFAAVTAKLISAIVYAKRIVQPLFYLYLKFQASSILLCLCSSVCVGPVQKPDCWFSHEAAHIMLFRLSFLCYIYRLKLLIRKSCPCNIYPLKPHFYIAKLGYAWGMPIFLIIAPKYRLWALVRTASPMPF